MTNGNDKAAFGMFLRAGPGSGSIVAFTEIAAFDCRYQGRDFRLRDGGLSLHRSEQKSFVGEPGLVGLRGCGWMGEQHGLFLQSPVPKSEGPGAPARGPAHCDETADPEGPPTGHSSSGILFPVRWFLFPVFRLFLVAD